ncbi:MAG: hypothetical protein ACI81T_004520, partial [Bacteroidia bacterium]
FRRCQLDYWTGFRSRWRNVSFEIAVNVKI